MREQATAYRQGYTPLKLEQKALKVGARQLGIPSNNLTKQTNKNPEGEKVG